MYFIICMPRITSVHKKWGAHNEDALNFYMKIKLHVWYFVTVKVNL